MDKYRGTSGAPHVYTHHNGPVQDLVFCYYTLPAQTRRTKTLETTLFKKLFHDMSDASQQSGKVTPANVRVTPVKWAIIIDFRFLTKVQLYYGENKLYTKSY